MSIPGPGSPEELEAFARLQGRLRPLYERVFQDPQAPRTVVVIPSLSVDADVMKKISGVHHYEERMLCMLMLLRLPRARLIYLTSQPIDPSIIDYYLHLLPGVPRNHARRRLILVSCHDDSASPLTQKILDRPRLVQRIRDAICDRESTHMACFNASPLERSLAVRLSVPLYACDPALWHLGTKSGSREVFREAGVEMPDGFEQLRDERDLAEALAELKHLHPELRQAVVKLDQGFSGEGNAIFSYDGCPSGNALQRWVRQELPSRLKFEAREEAWERYRGKFAEMGGVVECFVDDKGRCSPSVQCRIDPLGKIELVSTHEQVLGGPSRQVFLGCTFPADEAHRRDIQDAGTKVGQVLRRRGALGRFGVDFLSVRRGDGWRHYAVEINLRKGGTSHPFMMLQFLTDGTYDIDTGLYRTGTGRVRCYYASDNLQDPLYRGLTPDDLMDIAVEYGVHFNGATQEGVVFHLIGALCEFGKLGIVCIASGAHRAQVLYRETLNVLSREARRLSEQRAENHKAFDVATRTGE